MYKNMGQTVEEEEEDKDTDSLELSSARFPRELTSMSPKDD